MSGLKDYPELALEEEPESCTILPEPALFPYARLSRKQLYKQMQTARLAGLCRRQAVVEAAGQLPRYANIVRRLKMETDDEAPELYAKVTRPLNESGERHLIHFTPIPPAMQERLDGLQSKAEGGRSVKSSRSRSQGKEVS